MKLQSHGARAQHDISAADMNQILLNQLLGTWLASLH